MIPTELDALAELIMDEPSPAPKPDLYDRLCAQEGATRASYLWGQACSWNDSNVRTEAIDSLKDCLSQTKPDLDQASKDANTAWHLSHWQLSRPWAAVVVAIDTARLQGDPLDSASLLERIEQLEELEHA